MIIQVRSYNTQFIPQELKMDEHLWSSEKELTCGAKYKCVIQSLGRGTTGTFSRWRFAAIVPIRVRVRHVRKLAVNWAQLIKPLNYNGWNMSLLGVAMVFFQVTNFFSSELCNKFFPTQYGDNFFAWVGFLNLQAKSGVNYFSPLKTAYFLP